MLTCFSNLRQIENELLKILEKSVKKTDYQFDNYSVNHSNKMSKSNYLDIIETESHEIAYLAHYFFS